MNSDIDMTSGSLGWKILKYAIPLAITGMFQQLFNATDIAVVGRFAGKEAMAAVGSNAPVTNLLVNLFIGISLGTNVVIAKAIGEKNEECVHKTVHTSLIVALISGAIITLMGELIAPGVVRLLGVPNEVFAMCVKYLRIYLLGMPVILLYNFESAIFRSYGNTKTPLVALVISGVINIILNIIFVVGFGMDVDGVAIATVLSNLISSMMLFVALLRTDSVVKVRFESFKIHGDILKQVLGIGVPAGLQGMVFSFANIIIQSAVNSLGTTVMAASSAALNLEIFAYYIMNSYGQTCTTFVGQNYGARKADRCKKSLAICIGQDYCVTIAIYIFIMCFAETLLGLFSKDPQVIAIGRVRLGYIIVGHMFSAAQEPMTGYMRGFGMSLVPALCSVVGICVVRLTWIFTVFRASPSFSTIMQVYPLSLGITALAIFIMIVIVKPARKFVEAANMH